MGKLLTIILIIFAIEFMFSLAGWQVTGSADCMKPSGSYSLNDTSTSICTVFDLIQNPERITLSSLYQAIGGIGGLLKTVGIGTIIVGFLASSSRESFLLGGITGIFLGFVVDIVNLIKYVKGEAGATDPFGLITVLIFALLAIAYIIAAIDWWRGTDW